MKPTSLLRDSKIVHVAVDATNFTLAAGTTDVTSGIVDMEGYDEITWVVLLGTLAASSSVAIKAQQGAIANMSDAADLLGTAQTNVDVNDDDKMMGISISGVRERYHRLSITRGDGGNSTINGVIAILSQADKVPVTQSTAAGQFVAAPEFFQLPAEGTA